MFSLTKFVEQIKNRLNENIGTWMKHENPSYRVVISKIIK